MDYNLHYDLHYNKTERFSFKSGSVEQAAKHLKGPRLVHSFVSTITALKLCAAFRKFCY